MNELNYQTPFLSLNCLFDGFLSTFKSKPHKRCNLQYNQNLLINIVNLKDELSNMKYKKKHNSPFKIHERGKTRIICSSPVNDRIVGHVWWDKLIYPQILPKLTRYNCASIKGRGTDYFRKSLKKAMNDFYLKYGDNDGYIITWDISKYFDNLDHKILYKKMKKYCHCELELYILNEILNSFSHDVSWMSDEEYQNHGKFDSLENFGKSNSKEKMLLIGAYIGDLESQGFGIIYLDEVDHFLEQNPNVFWSGRYMDDFSGIVRNKKDAKQILADVKNIVESDLKCFLNVNKVRIYKLSKSFKLLNRHYYLTDKGIVVEKADKKTIRKEKVKLIKCLKKVKTLQGKGKFKLMDYIRNALSSWWGENEMIINQNKFLDEIFATNIVFQI